MNFLSWFVFCFQFYITLGVLIVSHPGSSVLPLYLNFILFFYFSNISLLCILSHYLHSFLHCGSSYFASIFVRILLFFFHFIVELMFHLFLLSHALFPELLSIFLCVFFIYGIALLSFLNFLVKTSVPIYLLQEIIFPPVYLEDILICFPSFPSSPWSICVALVFLFFIAHLYSRGVFPGSSLFIVLCVGEFVAIPGYLELYRGPIIVYMSVSSLQFS